MLWGRAYDNPKLITRGKAILTRIERIDPVERPVLEPKRMDLQINGWRGSNKVLEVTDLAKAFSIDAKHPERNGVESKEALFADLNLHIRHGERVGLVGPNGAGKSVLLKMILGEIEADRGEIIVGPSVSISCYAQ